MKFMYNACRAMSVISFSVGSYVALQYAVQKGSQINMKFATMWMFLTVAISILCTSVGEQIKTEIERTDWQKNNP